MKLKNDTIHDPVFIENITNSNGINVKYVNVLDLDQNKDQINKQL